MRKDIDERRAIRALGAVSVQTLQHPWYLETDPQNVGREERWFDAVRPDAREAPVPGIIQQVFPDYHGVAWYWHSFRPARAAGAKERYLLRFGAVDYRAEVWVNGVHVGGHEGGETPFELDVTKRLQPDQDNLLAVRVLNPIQEPIDGIVLEETPRDHKHLGEDYRPGRMFNYGGIVLPVEVLVVPAVRISDVYANPNVESGSIDIAITVRNDEDAPAAGQITAAVGPDRTGEVLETAAAEAVFAPGETVHILSVTIAGPHLWDLDDPYLYRVVATVEAAGEGDASLAHQQSVRCGFRDFCVVDGYFRLNGRRIFLRSTHTINHFPLGMVVPPTPDLMRRDLLYAKASGFNMVRFIAKVAWPEQLDYCDEIGLMVQEESMASWNLGDSPKMAERYDRSYREMILRDRNHPCITIWGLLNETKDGPVFRHAVAALSLVRSLDETRVVLLGSGRWDRDQTIGSICNPGSHEWEPTWRWEGPDPPQPKRHENLAGDFHIYPRPPHSADSKAFIRTLGADTKPVFLSEYGTGSMFNVIRELRWCKQMGARDDLHDVTALRSMADELEADWERLGFDGVYPSAEDLLRASFRQHAYQRRLQFDLARSNPQLCGLNVTGMLDQVLTGEGLWTFWREWKAGIVDVLCDGWAPLRWCLFAEPIHGYAGRPVKLEAVLANEDVLGPGEYPVQFGVVGPAGVAWERHTVVSIPEPAPGEDGRLAVPVLCEDVALDGRAGEYTFAAILDNAAPTGDRLDFRLTDPADIPALDGTVSLWGIDERVTGWLTGRGLRCEPFDKGAPHADEVIVVGVPESAATADWEELVRRMTEGSTVVFLEPQAFEHEDDPVYWLPLANKGKCYKFHDWVYHKECVAKAHPIFAGLQSKGMLEWDYYDQVIPEYVFEGQDTPDDVAAAAFAVGYSIAGGYVSAVLVGTYQFGAGRLVLNTMRVLEHVDKHPAADRLLVNLIRYAQQHPGITP